MRVPPQHPRTPSNENAAARDASAAAARGWAQSQSARTRERAKRAEETNGMGSTASLSPEHERSEEEERRGEGVPDEGAGREGVSLSTGEGSPPMHVVKRDGRREPVMFDKITARVRRLCWGLDERYVDPVLIAQKVSCSSRYLPVPQIFHTRALTHRIMSTDHKYESP